MTTATMCRGNARLHAALLDANLTQEQLADRLGVDPKTVSRWVAEPGRTPYARHAHAAAKVLHADAFYLWPSLEARAHVRSTAGDEMLACYTSRAAVPLPLWRDMLSAAESTIDIAVSCGLTLADTIPDLARVLTERASAGVRVRLALPDPASAASPVEAARMALAEDAFAELRQVPGVRVLAHAGVVNDVFRADDELLVVVPVDGCGPVASPVLHLRRLGQASLSGLYLTGLQHVFATAAPWRTSRTTVGVAR